MQFEVHFTHKSMLYYKDSSNVGLDGLARIKDAHPDTATEKAKSYVHAVSYRAISITVPEATAFASGRFRDCCKVDVAVTGEDYPLNVFLNLIVDQFNPRMRWELDEDAVIQAWMRADAPLEWSPGPDDEHVYLSKSTLDKLREDADNLQLEDDDALLLEGQRLYTEALVERLAQDGSTDLWTDLIGRRALSQIDNIDHNVDKIEFLRDMVCCGRAKAAPAKRAIVTRLAWIAAQDISWKDALLNELTKEDACIMRRAESMLASISDCCAFEHIQAWPDVRTTIRSHEGWLHNRPNIVELLPPLWREYYESLEV